MAFTYSKALAALRIGMFDGGSATSSINIDSSFVYETSGDAFFVAVASPVSQTSGNLTVYLFCTAVTGTPSFEIEILDGASGVSDPATRPGPGVSDIATSPSTLNLTTGDVDTWVSLSCTISMVPSQHYWIIIKNTHGTPASNHAAFQYRGQFDGCNIGSVLTIAGRPFFGGYTANGFTTNPTGNFSGPVCAVVKFDDGSLIGNPYVSSAAHANNANDRGVRVKFSENIIISQIYLAGSTGSISGIEINLAVGGSNIVRVLRGASENYFRGANSAVRFEPVTLAAGIAYDIVLTLSGSSTVSGWWDMGEAEGDLPADVLACRPFELGKVDGTTPGSYTIDNSQTPNWALFIDDNPKIVGGGGIAKLVGVGGGLVG